MNHFDLDAFLSGSRQEQERIVQEINKVFDEFDVLHDSWCDSNEDSLIGSGRIPQPCNCDFQKLLGKVNLNPKRLPKKDVCPVCFGRERIVECLGTPYDPPDYKDCPRCNKDDIHSR